MFPFRLVVLKVCIPAEKLKKAVALLDETVTIYLPSKVIFLQNISISYKFQTVVIKILKSNVHITALKPDVSFTLAKSQDLQK